MGKRTLIIAIIFFLVGLIFFGKNASNNSIYKQVVQNSLEGYGISEDGVVTMDDEYFGFLYGEIEEDPLKYAGQKVVVTGFVYKDSDLQDNEIKVSRILLPLCGSQENQVLGLICLTKNSAEFKNDEWITVNGTLMVTSYINTKTKSKSYKYYIEPESIERINRNSGYTL